MTADDVPLVCYFDGKLSDEDKNATYSGGTTKGGIVPKSILYASFKEKIQKLISLPSNGMEIKIKCGVPFDKFLIGMDVDDDNSLRFVIENSKVILAYILKLVPPVTTFTATRREEVVLSPQTDNQYRVRSSSNGSENHEKEVNPVEDVTEHWEGMDINMEDLVLPSAAVQFRAENPIDGTSNYKPVEIKSIGVMPPENDGMSTSRDALPTGSELREWFPEKLLPFIAGYENPSDDGNCGFRALCMALGKNENEWAWMRAELVKEIESNKVHYHQMFSDEETSTLLERTRHSHGPAPFSTWMLMPYTGFVFAQAFKKVLVYYFENNGCTFVPFLSPPNADNVKILGIGLVKNNHSIKLDFQYDCQLPPFPHVPSNWRTICPLITKSWEELLAPRLLELRTMNVSEPQIDQCLGKMIIIEGEDQVLPSAPIQFQGKKFVGGISNSYPLEDVNEHGDVIIVDSSGANIIRLQDMHHRFSHSNVDHQDEEINFQIRRHEDYEGNVQENTFYMENQFTSQMEKTSPPSDFTVPIQTCARVGSGDTAFDVKREFKDIEAFRNSFSDWALKEGHEYRPVRKTPSMLSMKCKSPDSCDWFIRVKQLPNSSTFKVVKYQDKHSCLGSERSCGGGDHRQATIKWIVSKMQSSIEKDPEMEPMKIVKEIKRQFGINISYNKAVKAKTKVLEVMRNHMLVKELELSGSVGKVGISSDGSQYLFWAFKACIDALRNHLRPVVFVGRVDTEIGVLMYAQGIDGDGKYGHSIEVGFAHCVREDEKSWERFLGWLKEFVLPPQPPPTFTIVTHFEDTALTRAIQNVLPHLHHFFSSSKFCSAFSKKIKDYNLYNLCRKACDTFSSEECEAALQVIKSKNEEAYEWLESVGSKSHWAPAFSPNKHARAFRNVDWYNLESMVEELMEEDKMSIVEIVESSRKTVADYFSERRMIGAEWIMMDIEIAEQFNLPHSEVESINGDKYQITDDTDDSTWVVHLEERSCTCGEFQATEYPCHHAFVVIVHLDLDVEDYLSHGWYSLDTYLAFSPNKHVRAIREQYLDAERRLQKSMVEDKMSIVEIVESSRKWVADNFSERRIKGAELITTTTDVTPLQV